MDASTRGHEEWQRERRRALASPQWDEQWQDAVSAPLLRLRAQVRSGNTAARPAFLGALAECAGTLVARAPLQPGAARAAALVRLADVLRYRWEALRRPADLEQAHACLAAAVRAAPASGHAWNQLGVVKAALQRAPADVLLCYARGAVCDEPFAPAAANLRTAAGLCARSVWAAAVVCGRPLPAGALSRSDALAGALAAHACAADTARRLRVVFGAIEAHPDVALACIAHGKVCEAVLADPDLLLPHRAGALIAAYEAHTGDMHALFAGTSVVAGCDGTQCVTFLGQVVAGLKAKLAAAVCAVKPTCTMANTVALVTYEKQLFANVDSALSTSLFLTAQNIRELDRLCCGHKMAGLLSRAARLAARRILRHLRLNFRGKMDVTGNSVNKHASFVDTVLHRAATHDVHAIVCGDEKTRLALVAAGVSVGESPL